MADEQAAEPGIYSIGAVSRLTGVPVASLRNWEERYRLVEPRRSVGGRRLYSRADLDRLTFVTEHIARGLSPADAHRLLAERLDAGEPAGPVPEGAAAPPTVLVAERDATAAAASARLLQAAGIDVALALTAEEARARAAELEPALAIVELLISGGAGIQLCWELTARGIAVLAISPLAARERALAAGVEAFLEKPLDPRAFTSTVTALLARRRAGTAA